MSVLKSAKRELVVSGTVYLLIGVLMCCWPVGTAGVMCIIAGSLLVVSGGIKLVSCFRKKDFSLMSRVDFSAAALGMILGIVLIAKADVFIALVPLLLGMIILVNSVFLTQTALELKQMQYTAWWRHLAIAAACFVLAVVMMFDPFDSYRVIAVAMGAAFIADGAADLWTALYLKGKLKKLGLL